MGFRGELCISVIIMTLVKCKECNGEVSEMAHKCPHCGVEVNPQSGEIFKYRMTRLMRIRWLCLLFLIVPAPSAVIFKWDLTTALIISALAGLGLFVVTFKMGLMRAMEDGGSDVPKEVIK